MTVTRAHATTFTTPTDHQVVITRVADAPRALVRDCGTKSEHLPNWMTGPDGWTMPVCEVDLRAGGGWHFVWRKTNGAEMDMRGGYLEVVPPERLVSTERWGAGVARDAEHRRAHRGERANHDHADGALSVEGGA